MNSRRIQGGMYVVSSNAMAVTWVLLSSLRKVFTRLTYSAWFSWFTHTKSPPSNSSVSFHPSIMSIAFMVGTSARCSFKSFSRAGLLSYRVVYLTGPPLKITSLSR